MHEAGHSQTTGPMHDRGKCMVAVCLLGSTGAPSFVLHRCMYIYIIACLLLVIQRTGFSIKFAFPWLPDQAGMEFLRGTDGKVDEPFRRPMHKDTCTHMLLCATNTEVCICACIPTRVIRLFRRCGSQGQAGSQGQFGHRAHLVEGMALAGHWTRAVHYTVLSPDVHQFVLLHTAYADLLCQALPRYPADRAQLSSSRSR